MTTVVEQTKPTSVKDIIAFLVAQYPQCFSVEGPASPLKIGIFQDLVARLQDESIVSKTQLRQALRIYTSSWRYLAAVKEGVARIDLDGQAGDLIDASQAQHAAEQLAQSKEKAAQQRKARILAQREQEKQQRTEARSQHKSQQVATADVDASDAERPSTATQPHKTRPARAVKPVAGSEAKQKFNRGEHKSAGAKSNGQTRVAKTATVESADAPMQALAELKVVAAEHLKVGSQVFVKLGQKPMPATVVEVIKHDVTVQLASGMVVKTPRLNIYQA